MVSDTGLIRQTESNSSCFVVCQLAVLETVLKTQNWVGGWCVRGGRGSGGR